MKAIKNFFRSIKLIYQSKPSVFIPLTVLLLAMSFVPILQQNALQIFIDQAGSIESVREGLIILAPFFIALLIDLVSGPILMFLQGDLTDQLIRKVNSNLQNKINEINHLEILEDPSYYDKIELIEGEIAWRPINLLVYSLSVFRMGLTLIIMMVQLATFRVWIPILMLLSLIPQSILLYKLQVEAYENTVTRSPLAKVLRYFSDVLLKRDYAKERISFAFGKKIQNDYEKTFESIYEITKRDRRKKGLASVIMSIVGTGLIAFTIGFFVSRVIAGEFTLGSLALFISYTVYTGASSITLVQEGALLIETELFMENYFEFLDTDVNMEAGDKDIQEISSIEFKNVSYKYAGRDDYALKNVSFKVQAPNKIALVGINGSGKTTLIKLILRLYDPTDGEIFINGENIKAYNLKALRKCFGILYQDFNKFEISALENIIISNADEDINQGRLQDALKNSGANDVVDSLKNGLDTNLGKLYEDGTDLSGGQWQKIACARAFYKESSCKIFDEPSSALDPISERDFWDRLMAWSEKDLTIFTSHRLQGIKNAGYFLVLKNGDLVEEGTFDEVYNRRGEFYSLYNAQK